MKVSRFFVFIMRLWKMLSEKVSLFTFIQEIFFKCKRGNTIISVQDVGVPYILDNEAERRRKGRERVQIG
jgi:hypothetical protein